jgi:hypothetical protein
MTLEKGRNWQSKRCTTGARRNRNAIDMFVIRMRNSCDPKAFLERAMAAEAVPLQLRIMAANCLMPYVYSKCAERRITTPVTLPPAMNAAQVRTNIAAIGSFMASRQVSLDAGLDFGLVASMNRPGGNVTGVLTLSADLPGKQLGLLHLVPKAATIAVLVDPRQASWRHKLSQVSQNRAAVHTTLAPKEKSK